MKFNLPLCAVVVLASASPVKASLLVGFHDFDNQTNTPLTRETHDGVPAVGFSGIVIESLASENSGGSNDNKYGNSNINVLPVAPLPNATQDGHAKVQNGNNLTFEILNGSGLSVSLNSFLFDAAYKISTGSVLNLAWNIVGDLESGSTAVSASSMVQVENNFASPVNYSDFSLNLIGVTLDPGQTIRFVFSTPATGGETFRIDNVALTSIPEVTSLLALGGLLSAGCLLRNRRRSAPIAGV